MDKLDAEMPTPGSNGLLVHVESGHAPIAFASPVNSIHRDESDTSTTSYQSGIGDVVLVDLLAGRTAGRYASM